MCNIS